MNKKSKYSNVKGRFSCDAVVGGAADPVGTLSPATHTQIRGLSRFIFRHQSYHRNLKYCLLLNPFEG